MDYGVIYILHNINFFVILVSSERFLADVGLLHKFYMILSGMLLLVRLQFFS